MEDAGRRTGTYVIPANDGAKPEQLCSAETKAVSSLCPLLLALLVLVVLHPSLCELLSSTRHPYFRPWTCGTPTYLLQLYSVMATIHSYLNNQHATTAFHQRLWLFLPAVFPSCSWKVSLT